MPTLAYFGINSSGLNLAIDLLILFLVVLYFSLVYWTYADARRRIVDPMLIGCATAASLFPFVGAIVYIILRPPEYLEDVRERELEMQAAEVRLQQLDHTLCPHCDHYIERDFLRCPSCLRKLKEPCVSCGRPLERTWSICPYCEAEVPGAAQARRGARKRERSASGAEGGASVPAPAGRGRIAIGSEAHADEGEAQTEEGEILLGEESMSTSPGATEGSGGRRTAVPASNPGSASRGSTRAGRPRPSS